MEVRDQALQQGSTQELGTNYSHAQGHFGKQDIC